MVVVDASLAAMWVVPEKFTPQALALAEEWAQNDVLLIAPCLILVELTNAFYKRVLRKEIDLPAAISALNLVMDFGIELREEPGLHVLAMKLAHKLKRPSTYDCHYLALAEAFQCSLWTGDEKFFNSARRDFPRVKWVGNYANQ